MNKILIVLASIALVTSSVYALEKKPVKLIDSEQLVEDTQFSASCGDDHMNFCWWIPSETWQSFFVNDPSMSESEKKEIIDTLRPYSLLMICQADISSFGAFSFYSKEEIESKLNITLKSKNQDSIKLEPLKTIDPDVQLMINMFKPIFSAALGNMGQNMHIIVLDDYDSKQKRKVNPYGWGALQIRIGSRNGESMQAHLDFPINSLYLARKCPNGKDAHVTWKFCPWTGKKLEE